MTKTKRSAATLIGGKTIAQWDTEWVVVPGGFTVAHPEYRRVAGLYRANLHGETKVIGMASENRGGRLFKRLSDFTRAGSSGRNHHTGTFIHDNAERLELQVLPIGQDRAARELCLPLRKAMIELHKPSTNVPLDIVKHAAFR